MKRYKNGTSKNKQDGTPGWQSNIVLFAKLNGWIISPVIIAFIVGKWLDHKYDLGSWSFFVLVGFAFVVSIVGITKETMRTMESTAKTDKKDLSGYSKEAKDDFK